MKLVLQHLTKTFPNRNKKEPDVTAVNDFCFEIPDGRLIGLLGPSGCGKSTTLNLISGLEKPTSGKILFGEDDVTELPPESRGVGLVFQNYALYPHLTVRHQTGHRPLPGASSLPQGPGRYRQRVRPRELRFCLSTGIGSHICPPRISGTAP